MKKAANILKLAGIIVCSILFLWLMVFDIIDWLVPGNFPDWLYAAAWIALGMIAVLEILNFIKDLQKNKP